MIVKVQRPLNPNNDGMLLVYNEDRTHEFFVPVDSVPGRELLKIMGDAPQDVLPLPDRQAGGEL